MSWFERLGAATRRRGRLCVGIDPMDQVLDSWDLPHTVGGLETLCRGIVEEIGQKIAVFKPQSAFFERFGSAGVAVLERVLDDIRGAGALSLLDVKRGDIGSSMNGYAQAYLDNESPLRADAITLSPFLGFGSLLPAVELAASTGRGIYVLARTSNPESATIQMAVNGQDNISQHIVNSAQIENVVRGNCVGLVVGATHSDPGVALSGFTGSILVPGIGAQGGTIHGLTETFAEVLPQVLPTASRGVIAGGRAGLHARASELLESVSELPTAV